MANGGPQTVSDWIKYLHNASQVRPGSADYGEAREAISLALRHIHALNVGAAEAEATANEQPSAAQSVATVIGQGAGLGTGEVFRGLGTALAGEGFRKGANEYRQAVDQAEAADPNLQALGQILTGAALPTARIGQGLAGIKAGVPLGLVGGAKLIGQGAITGAVPGAVAGFSSGGADPGDLQARLASGKRGAILGALLGGVTTAAAMPIVRGHIERAADIANKGVMRKLQAQRLRNAEAAGLRMAKRDLPTHVADGPLSDISQAVRDFDAGRISQEDLNTAMQMAGGALSGEAPQATSLPIEGEVAATPPESATPISEGPPGSGVPKGGGTVTPGYAGNPQGIDVTGVGPVPTAATSAPTLAEMTGTKQLGDVAELIAQRRQGTLPYYPRGGRVEQSVGAKPIESMPAPLSKTNLRNADPGTIAAFLKNQMALAEATGSPVTPATLGRLLEGIGLTPEKFQAVLKEVQAE